MSRATLILNSKAAREKASRWCLKAPINSRVEFKAAKRSLPQNDHMWAALTDIAQQVDHHGLKLTADDWKLDGTGMVNLGRSSSDLSKAEMTDLIELIHEFGARKGVVFHNGEGAGGSDAARAA